MEEIDLIEVFKIFWRKKIPIILITLIFTVIGYIYTTKYVVPQYSSSTTLVLASQNENNTTNTSTAATDVIINTKLVSTYSELIKSKNVLNEVISNLIINKTYEELKNNISVSSITNTALIELKVTNENPESASKIANEIANVFVKKISEIYNINTVQIVDEAEIPTSLSNINHKKDIIIFAFIGAVVSIIYVLLSNMLDTTVKTAEEIEKEFKLPVVASIPIYNAEPQRRNGGKR